MLLVWPKMGNEACGSYLIEFISKFPNRGAIFFNHKDKQPYGWYGRNGLCSDHVYFFGQEI